MSGVLPIRLPGESTDDFLDRLRAALDQSVGTNAVGSGSTSGSVAYLYDEHGRPLVTPQGLYGYSSPTDTQFTAPVQPNIVQIDTAQLVDAAVSTAKVANLAIHTAQIADAAIVTAKIGDAQIVTAKIADLAVNTAKISDLAVGKLTAGTISASGIFVGSTNFELDGVNRRLRISDGTNTRVDIGKIGAGATDYGITIRDASNNVILSSGATSSIDGAFINSLSATKISAGTLSAGVILSSSIAATQIAAGTLAAGVVYAGNIVAGQVVAGTFTGLTFQTGSSGQRVVISAAANRLEAYDSGGTQIAAIGQLSLGGAVYAAANSPAFASGYFTNSVGNVLQVTQTSPAAANIAVSITSYCTGLSVSTGGSLVGSFAAAVLESSGPVQAVLARNTSGASGGHALRGQASGGGSGLVGVPAANGGWAFYKETGGIGPFTAQHDALIPKSAATPEVGDIMVDTDTIWTSSIDDAITAVEPSSAANQKGAIGIYRGLRNVLDFAWIPNGLSIRRDGDRDYCEGFDVVAADYDLIQVNSVGEGCINVCGEGGDIEIGDLIVTSSMPGKGMKQADDLVRACTVAKARENVAFSSPSEQKLIACVYLCG